MVEITSLADPPAPARRAIGWRGRVSTSGALAAAVIRLAGIPLACLAVAMLSIGLQGFELGVDNNVFHLPIVLRWYDLPQFADDAVIQSLRRYATPVFTVLGWISDEHDVAAVFLAAHLATRTLTFFALAQIARAVGLSGAKLIALLSALALCAVVYGDSAIGRDELLVDVFTHTALAQAVALLGIAWLIRGKLAWACMVTGIALDLNVMVGVWQTAPIVMVALADLVRGRTSVRHVLASAALFAAAAAPVTAWILSTQRFGSMDFDYRAFLTDYYPFHFFIGWASWPDRINLALQALGGLWALCFLPKGRATAAAVLIGFCSVFLVGAIVDQVTHSRFILNLHLLRSDAMIAWMATLLMAAAAVVALSTSRLSLIPGAAAVLGALVIGQWWAAATGMALLIVVDRLPRKQGAARTDRGKPWRGPVIGAVATGMAGLAAMASGAYRAIPRAPAPGSPPTDAQLAGMRPAAPEWLAVANWSRLATQKSAVFLVPWKLDFTVTAQRRSWVGWKEGAAAMWAPETYPAWRTRGAEVRALRDTPSQLAYACRRHIDYVIFDKRPGHGLPDAAAASPTIYANRWFSVVKPQGCGGR